MTKRRLVFAFSCLALFTLATSPVFANGVKADLSASGKGVVNPTGGCVATIVANPECVDFAQTSSTMATWTAFSLINGGPTFSTLGPFDLFLVSGITDGTQVTFTLTGASDVFGSFLCGDDPTMTTQLAGFCADPTNSFNGDPSGIFSQDPAGADANGLATFIFNASAPGTWFFYATEGHATISVSNGSTSAPEPGTLLLLAAGAGLLAIVKFRRA